MQITITEQEIKKAVSNYIKERITFGENQEIDVTFKATRGDSGITAEILIEDREVKAVAATSVASASAPASVATTGTTRTVRRTAAPQAEVSASEEVAPSKKEEVAEQAPVAEETAAAPEQAEKAAPELPAAEDKPDEAEEVVEASDAPVAVGAARLFANLPRPS